MKNEWGPRELDIKIARDLFKLDVREDQDGPWIPSDAPNTLFGEDFLEVPKYSEDIRSAMEVANALGTEWGFGAWHYALLSSSGFGWVVAFAHNVRPPSIQMVAMGDPERVKSAHANSLPEAICLAAVQVIDSGKGVGY